MKTPLAPALALVWLAAPLWAETLTLAPQPVTDWKAVFGQVQAQTLLPARARIGGVLTELTVAEGDMVAAGQPLARIEDEKLDLQLTAMDAQIAALSSQLENARSELARGEELLARGVTTVQFLDGLRTQADVLTGQLAAMQAERAVVVQQASEGVVLAPIAGRVLTVPLAAGAVVMPGEAVATLGGGGFFLRLAIPERHAAALREGDDIAIAAGMAELSGRLARVYPQIENGRVIADVAVDALDDAFVNARVLVRLPVGERMALLVPEGAVTTRSGLDFVTVAGPFEGARTVVLGQRHQTDTGVLVEILSGLAAGDAVVLP
ncbi:MAG: efflux RND transporter periplasmic adaptor subunit [Roseinatronobacter sp.]|nr:efflux RND transporter periplasmic adaptor subunit [Roseinatronobacter sp.]